MIIGLLAGVNVPTGFGSTVEEISAAYAGNREAIAFSAAWFVVVLLGRCC